MLSHKSSIQTQLWNKKEWKTQSCLAWLPWNYSKQSTAIWITYSKYLMLKHLNSSHRQPEDNINSSQKNLSTIITNSFKIKDSNQISRRKHRHFFSTSIRVNNSWKNAKTRQLYISDSRIVGTLPGTVKSAVTVTDYRLRFCLS